MQEFALFFSRYRLYRFFLLKFLKFCFQKLRMQCSKNILRSSIHLFSFFMNLYIILFLLFQIPKERNLEKKIV